MIIERNNLLIGLLMLFAAGGFIYRYWDVYARCYGRQGKVYHRWTLPVLAILHTSIGIFSVLEFLIYRHTYNIALGASSILIFLLGQILRNWAIASLGEFHSQHIEIKPNHRFVRKGPYAFMRHPYYAGVILEVLSTPLIFNSYYSFIWSCVTYPPMIGLRIFLEDQVMKPIYGNTGIKQ